MIKFLVSFLLLFSFHSYSQESLKVSDIKIEGLQRVDPGFVFNNIPFEINDEITSIDFAKTISLLYKTGQFKDVSVEREGSLIIISVNERPLIYEIKFHGAETFQTDLLIKGLSFMNISSGLVFDNTDLIRAEQEISKQYLASGKYNVDIRSEVVPLDRNRVNINFYIAEGRNSRIKSISITGSRSFEQDDLLAQFSLKTTNLLSWWNKDDRYSKQVLTGDLEKLKSFYMNRGFLDFKIDSTVVSISKNNKNIYVALSIVEGEKYVIGSIKISGKIPAVEEKESFDTKLNISNLKEAVLIQEGDTFNRKMVNESTVRITKILGNYGYAFTNVSAVPTIDNVNNVVSFDFYVDTGKKIYVRRINVFGNDKTKDKVIRREMRQLESSWFSQDNIDRSKTRLTRTQFFDSVDIETPGVAGVSDQIDINIKVKERDTGKLNIGAGVSSGEGLVGSFGISQANFLGTGNSLATTINTGGINKTYSMTFNDPYYTDDGVSRGFSLYRRDSNTKSLGTGTYDTSSVGLGINFGIPISEKEVVLIGSSMDMTDIELASDSPVGYLNYCSSINKAGALKCSSDSLLAYSSYTKDTRDNLIFPSSGYKFSISGDLALPVFDMKYYKIKISGEKFFPLSSSVTTRLSGDIGYADGYSDELLPFFKNYKIGGARSIRGYSEGAVGKKVYDSSYGDYVTYGGKKLLAFSAETYFPVPGLKNNESFRLSTFFDAGGVFEDSINADDFRYSAGATATWLSPFGPLNVSVAIPLNDDNLDKTQTLQFGMGTNF